MIYVYAIKSIKQNYIYVGMTDNLQRRVSQHQSGYEKTTKPYRPFVLIHYEKYASRDQARAREKYLKSAAGKRFLRSLIQLLKKPDREGSTLPDCRESRKVLQFSDVDRQLSFYLFEKGKQAHLYP